MSIIESRRRITAKFITAIVQMNDSAKDELAAQGHKASGKLIDSLEYKVDETFFDGLSAAIMVEDYGRYVDTGTKPHLPPVSALIDWARYVQPSMSDKERRSFAFAVRANMGKVGTPSSGSFAFSKNGRRTDWINEGIEKQEPQDWASELDLENELFKIIGT